MLNQKKLLWLIPIVALVLACILFFSGSYQPNATALAAMASDDRITVQTQGSLTLFSPALPEAGFIFYPGGRVDQRAYAPLMAALARKNILCVLVEMPGDLAVLNPGAAEKIPEQFPEIRQWFIGGHSLGGSMAASCAADNPELFEGLVMLAAYATEDLSQTELEVLSIYGTEDQVLNRERYAEYQSNLPETYQEIVIRGGNHAYFGSYGIQKGDGIAAIAAGEQTALTAAYLYTFFT